MRVSAQGIVLRETEEQMTAITISRQMGSMGCEVAQAVSKATGYRIVMREVINQAAQQAGAPEMALHEIDELGLLGFRPSAEEQQAYREALIRVMREFAEEGEVIIVGRAGQVILRDRPDVLHVRVVAADDVRIERLAAEHHIPVEAARAQIETSDRSRRNFLKRAYQVDWDDSRLYDLILNTNRLTPEAAAQIICKALADLVNRTHPSSKIDVCID